MDQSQTQDESKDAAVVLKNGEATVGTPPEGSLQFHSTSQFSQAFKEMNTLRGTKNLCDVTFLVGGKRLYAHRIVLASLSPYFKAMFTCKMAESKQEEITLKGIDLTTLAALIEYTYTATIVVTEDNVQSLLPAASILQLNKIRQVCSDFLQQRLDTDNCLGIMEFAELHDCTQLQSAATAFSFSHFSEVCRKEEFLNFSFDKLRCILDKDQLSVESEFVVYEAVISWVKYKHDRMAHIYGLMRFVRLPLLSAKDLLNKVGCNPLVLGDPKCVELLLEAIQCYLLPDSKEEIDAKKLQPRKPHRQLYAIGGWDGNTAVRTVECFDTETGQWEMTTPTLTPRNGVSLAVLNDKLYAVGGHNGQTFLQSVEEFDPRSNKWENVAPLKHKRASAGVTTHDGYVYAFGGQDSNFKLKSVERYDPVINQWQSVASMHCRRDSPGAVSHGNHVYAIGGCHACMFLNTVERYDPKTNQWCSVMHMPQRRSAVGAISLGDYIYVFGGHDERNNLCLLERFDPITENWTTLCPMNSPRAGVGGALFDGKIVAAGGYDGIEQLNTIEEYNPDTDSWKFLSPMTCERSYVGAVVMTKMV